VAMAVAGLKSCWAAKLISTLRKLGELPHMHSADFLCKHEFDVDHVVDKMHMHIFQSLMNTHCNPRTSPSVGATHCAYMQWFAMEKADGFHPHIKCITMPTTKHQELMRFRLGCADIAVNSGRFELPCKKKARAERTCPCCTSGQAEDELHVVFECTAYDTIRNSTKFAGLFEDIPVGGMKKLFSDPQRQHLLADFVRALSLARKQRIASLPVLRTRRRRQVGQ
jgi:hypothetical protein